MTRVKRSVHARKKRRATLKLAKGYRGDASRHYRTAKEAVLKADQYRYRDRRNRKRDFRRLWITRINAAARQNGHVLLAVHARPADRRRRARPQDPRRHGRARRRHLPTFCRARPRGVGRPEATSRTTTPPRAPLHWPAPFFIPVTITSPDNQKLKEIRKLLPAATAGASARGASSPRARTCWRRPTPRAGLPVRPLRAAGGDVAGLEVEPAAGRCLDLGSGTRALAVYEELGTAPDRATVRLSAWGRRPRGNVGTVLRGASLRRRLGRARPGPPTPTAPRRCGRAWARCSRSRSRAASVDELPGGGWPSSRTRASRCGAWRAGDAAHRRRARRACRPRSSQVRPRGTDPHRPSSLNAARWRPRSPSTR